VICRRGWWRCEGVKEDRLESSDCRRDAAESHTPSGSTDTRKKHACDQDSEYCDRYLWWVLHEISLSRYEAMLGVGWEIGQRSVRQMSQEVPQGGVRIQGEVCRFLLRSVAAVLWISTGEMSFKTSIEIINVASFWYSEINDVTFYEYSESCHARIARKAVEINVVWQWEKAKTMSWWLKHGGAPRSSEWWNN